MTDHTKETNDRHGTNWITVQMWAQNMFGDCAPRYTTLRKWVYDGLISPQPQKRGWIWFVDSNARYLEKSAQRRADMRI